MAQINPLIALQTQGVDTATPILQAQQIKTQTERNDALNELREIQAANAKIQGMNAREQARFDSMINASAELGSYLESGNVEGAEAFLTARRADLGKRIAAGEDVDTVQTDFALQAIRSGDEEAINALTQQTQKLTALGGFRGLASQTGVGGATGELAQLLVDENNGINSVFDALEFMKGGAGATGKLQAEIEFGESANKAKQDGKNKSDLEFKPQIAAETSRAEFVEEGFQGLPKAARVLESKELLDGALDTKIASIRERASKLTTGFGGALSGVVPGTPAYDLKSDVETLLANAGFDRLSEMRANSPTGGALGQVSERELSLLQAAAQNLQTSQSKGQFLRNLDAFEEQRRSSLENIRKAYEEDFRRFGGEQDAQLRRPEEDEGPGEISLEDFLNE